MEHVWSLDSVYRGFEDPAFAADLECVKKKIAQFTALTKDLAAGTPLEVLRTGIALQEDINALAQKMSMYASLRQYADSRDAQAQSQLGRLMGIFSAFAAPEAAFQEWAAALPNLMELAESDEILKQYTFLFANMKNNSRYLLGSRGEEIMAKMQLSGGNACSQHFQGLLCGLFSCQGSKLCDFFLYTLQIGGKSGILKSPVNRIQTPNMFHCISSCVFLFYCTSDADKGQLRRCSRYVHTKWNQKVKEM